MCCLNCLLLLCNCLLLSFLAQKPDCANVLYYYWFIITVALVQVFFCVLRGTNSLRVLWCCLLPDSDTMSRMCSCAVKTHINGILQCFLLSCLYDLLSHLASVDQPAVPVCCNGGCQISSTLCTCLINMLHYVVVTPDVKYSVYWFWSTCNVWCCYDWSMDATMFAWATLCSTVCGWQYIDVLQFNSIFSSTASVVQYAPVFHVIVVCSMVLCYVYQLEVSTGVYLLCCQLELLCLSTGINVFSSTMNNLQLSTVTCWCSVTGVVNVFSSTMDDVQWTADCLVTPVISDANCINDK